MAAAIGRPQPPPSTVESTRIERRNDSHDRDGCARDVATAHTRLDGTPWDVAAASRHAVRHRPGPTRRSRKRSSSRSPSTTHARFERARAAPPEGGNRTVHVGTAAGSPAAAPERLGAEAPRPPSTTLGGDGSNRPIPARPVATSRHRRRPPAPLRRPQPSDVPTGRPRPGRKTRRLPPVSPQTAPTTASLRTSEPTRAVLRPEHGRSRDPSSAPHERVQVTDRTSPPVPLGTSSRQPISADPAEPTAPTSPPARSAPRNHASSQFRTRSQLVRSLRAGASPDPVVAPREPKSAKTIGNEAAEKPGIRCPASSDAVLPPRGTRFP
jgi:hypothetical protein